MNKLDDIQLAMVVIRLYEGGDLDPIPPTLKKMLYEEILGCKEDGSDYIPGRAHPDPFLRSMTFWVFKEYSAALCTLLQVEDGTLHPRVPDDDFKGVFSRQQT